MDTKKKIIESAARLILVKGYNHTGLKEILDIANVPKGSFYYYFKNKEDLAIYLLDYYYDNIKTMMDLAFDEFEDQPILGIIILMKRFTASFVKKGFTGGCGIGNLGQELSDTDEPIRQRAKELFTLIESRIEAQLCRAQELGMLSENINCAEYAQFIYNSWQGALLSAKIKKSEQPITIYFNQIFQ